jgi:hypothetical protein
MKSLFAAATLLSVASAIAFAQRPPAPYHQDTNNVPISPEIHSDRSVTFRLFAPKASEVVLMGSQAGSRAVVSIGRRKK